MALTPPTPLSLGKGEKDCNFRASDSPLPILGEGLRVRAGGDISMLRNVALAGSSGGGDRPNWVPNSQYCSESSLSEHLWTPGHSLWGDRSSL